jgi:hypothetical protein
MTGWWGGSIRVVSSLPACVQQSRDVTQYTTMRRDDRSIINDVISVV